MDKGRKKGKVTKRKEMNMREITEKREDTGIHVISHQCWKLNKTIHILAFLIKYKSIKQISFIWEMQIKGAAAVQINQMFYPILEGRCKRSSNSWILRICIAFDAWDL